MKYLIVDISFMTSNLSDLLDVGKLQLCIVCHFPSVILALSYAYSNRPNQKKYATI